MTLELKYFVLKPRSKFHGDPWARAAREAMLVFAREIVEVDRDLSHELLAWVEREEMRDGQKPHEEKPERELRKAGTTEERDVALIEAFNCIQKVKTYIANWQPHTKEERELLDSLLNSLWNWNRKYGEMAKKLEEERAKKEKENSEVHK